MPHELQSKCNECRDAIHRAIIAMLVEKIDYIAAMERTACGDLPVTGIAVEIFPWYGALGLSLRLSSDYPSSSARYDSADWTHFDFTHDCKSPDLVEATSFIEAFYRLGHETDVASGGIALREFAHLIFQAAAEALLEPDVAELLRDLGIKAPTIVDELVSGPFQYIVTDADETVKSNYCDLVMSQRVTQRLLAI